jgi:phage terminase large subunit GpA-like protein
MIDWSRALASGDHRRCVMICATQMGKTDSALDVVGERLDNQPAPILYVGPSKEFCTDQLEPRLMQLLDEAPTLADKVGRGKRNKKTRKLIAGVSLRLAHAGSPIALKSDPAGLSIIDEFDGMAATADGGVLALVEARGSTYADSSVGITSTPSLGVVDTVLDETSGLEFWRPGLAEDIESPAWRLWQEGTMHHWTWPCPHCGEYFVPRFSCLRWATPEGGKATPAEARRSSFIECPHCGGAIEDGHKTEMNANGRMVAPGQIVSKHGVVIGDPSSDSSTVSYWVSGLCSPFVSLGSRAERYLSAVRLGDFKDIQSAVNTNFGEVFAPAGGEAPEWVRVSEHRSDYLRGELPEGVIHLVATVDVQRDRLIWVVRGWGARGTSWLIDHGELWGDTVEQDVWNDLAEFITAPICGKRLRMVLVDSGYRPGKPVELPLNRIYDFCRRFPRFVLPTKGASRTMRASITKSRIEVTPKGAVAKYGLELILLDTDRFKSWVHERVRWPDDQPGSWYLPSDIEDGYCRQIVSEARMRLASGKVRWVERSKQNHYLDLESMQAAAADMLNVHRISGMARPTQRQEAPSPGQEPETGFEAGRPAPPQHRDKDPNEYHQAFLEKSQPYNWVRDGGRPRGWMDRDRE